MFTARNDRLRTRTFVLRTDACTPAETLHGDPAGVNFASTSFRPGPPAQDRPPGSTRLVEARELRAMRRGPDRLRIGLRLARDRQHGVRELVERLLALRLGGLDHDRALHHQREVDRRRAELVMEA